MSLPNSRYAMREDVSDAGPVTVQREPLWRETHLSLGASMLLGSLYESAHDVGAASLRIAEARMEGSCARMQEACEELTNMANRAAVLSATLERELAKHRRRSPLTGVK